MLRNQRFFLLLLVICLLILTACVNFNISNLAEVGARVRILTPDGGDYTRLIEADGYVESFSVHGGNYTILVLPNEEYLRLLHTLREQISSRLFQDRGSISPDEIDNLVARLQEIDDVLDTLKKEGASCSGTAPDFSNVNASLFWSETASNWQISCGVVESE